MIVFISGGVRSGKSRVAEQCAQRLADEGDRLHYIATAKKTDEEMAERIRHHQLQREKGRWKTWEQPHTLREIVSFFHTCDVVLLDCLTNLWANEMFQDEQWQIEEKMQKRAQNVYRDILDLASRTKGLVIVSNELFNGGVPSDAGTYLYMKGLGWLHQQIVAVSSVAIVMQYGIPIVKKGERPCGTEPFLPCNF
ncbi:adenosylcobinamide kinase /adenosylcobinamide-phosphate guanylyltransferase [Thermolongibacillus altinsuensis]|uniref:Adenosylcobinamide kinase n=1 Tax=Thermolongibacillus altinsuensis TaxID=575256 RepID=A0A4R1QJ54_9BACL|nr:bifunctional adenosylcobinamide kinase/adenosylcobinamide-phosphate guanylyltransferase [Thermolongibacillus altinsuensis]TCL53117.1 adenosylcobinamide kinase /adenosylcobinamide-phosphate guanylyltransferase [Thermolongibacillus altinsuensis]